MNRKGIFLGLMILSIFTANGLFAFDLWEGLDTNMTKDQLLAKAREVLKVQRPPVQKAGFISFDNSFVDAGLKNRSPQNLTAVDLASTLPNFGAIEFAGEPVTNVSLIFSDNKLFAILIRLKHSNDGGYKSGELNALLTRQYGEPKQFKMEPFMGREMPSRYVWETPEKIIYVQGLAMQIINKQMLR